MQHQEWHQRDKVMFPFSISRINMETLSYSPPEQTGIIFMDFRSNWKWACVSFSGKQEFRKWRTEEDKGDEDKAGKTEEENLKAEAHKISVFRSAAHSWRTQSAFTIPEGGMAGWVVRKAHKTRIPSSHARNLHMHRQIRTCTGLVRGIFHSTVAHLKVMPPPSSPHPPSSIPRHLHPTVLSYNGHTQMHVHVHRHTLSLWCTHTRTRTDMHTHTHTLKSPHPQWCSIAVMVLCEGQADQGDWADWGSVLRR